MTTKILEAALAYAAAGMSVIPTIPDDTKQPYYDLLPRGENGKGTWTPFKTEIADDTTIRKWYGNGSGANVALICGAVSGGVLAIDFDVPRSYDAWRESVGELADGLPVEKTRKGDHVFSRYPSPGRNQVLAYIPDEAEPSGRRSAIETRAEGGYIVVSPSVNGDTPYTLLSGDLTAIPKVSQARADVLLDAARRLDECPLTRQEQEQESHAQVSSKPRAGTSVIDAYNTTHTIDELLKQHGYKPNARGDKYIRPGGEHYSVTVRDGRSFHHNSNDTLCDGYWHSAFDVFCKLEHGGDVHAAVKAAAAEIQVNYHRLEGGGLE